jgi:SHOCT-like domain
MGEEQLQILKMLEEGQIGAEEAAELLAALRPEEEERSLAAQPQAALHVRTTDEAVEEPAPRPELSAERAPAPGWEGPPARWSRFWIYPAMVGGGLLILGAVVLGLLYAAKAASGWRVCGWLPMILGMVVAILAWWSRTARWLHLRVKEKGERNIAFSFPLPLTLTAWVLRIIRPYVPQLKDTGVDEMILALRDTDLDEPFFVEVQDDKEGEHVQVYIG